MRGKGGRGPNELRDASRPAIRDIIIGPFQSFENSEERGRELGQE